MLTASQSVPKPANWQGVTEGLAEAQKQLRLGEYAIAGNLIRDILEFAPVEARAWHLLGLALQRGGEHEEALQCFYTASSLYEDHEGNHENRPVSLRLARLLWEQGDRLGAQTMLDALLQKNPADSRLLELQASWQEKQA